MDAADLPRVLCVDDEPHILQGLALHLHRHFELATATSAAAALEVIQRESAFAVVLSDMRMPGMDGATFLGRVRQVMPDAVRVLLTGQADLDAAIAAVNEGQVFRFLTKPCPPVKLITIIQAAAAQHRLVTAERVLLEQTLLGSIKTLTDVLALANPVAFGRAARIKQHVIELAEKLEIRDRWHIEVAAMLSQIGCITLPAETVEKFFYGQQLDSEERAMVQRLPNIAVQLLGNIPRLEPVLEILAAQTSPWTGTGTPIHVGEPVPLGVRLLQIASDFDALETRGLSRQIALRRMQEEKDCYDPEILAAFFDLQRESKKSSEVRKIPLRAVRVGMIFTEDILRKDGALLITRGYEVTAGFVQATRNFRDGFVQKKLVRVIVPAHENS